METVVPGASLWDVFGSIPDHRNASGRRYPLPAALCIAVAAMLAGRTSLSAIRRWASRLRPEALREMGIWRGRAPSQGAWHYILRDLSIRDLESALGAWVGAARLDGQPLHVAIDGKTARGSAGAESPPLHVLAAYCEPLRGVLGQWRVEPGENEIVTALRMLRELPLNGLIITGDAIFAQREICRQITEGGGDYFFVVKDNQPALKEHIKTAFTPPISPLGRARVGA